MNKQIKKEIETKLIIDYIENKLSIEEIKEKYYLGSKQTIYNILKRYSIKNRRYKI